MPPSSRAEQFVCTLLNTLLLVKLCSHRYFLPVLATSFPCQNPSLDSSLSHLACFLLTPELFGNCFNKYLWSLCVFQGSFCFFQTLSWQISGSSQSLSEILWTEHPQKSLLGDLGNVSVWELWWSLSLFLWLWILEMTFRYMINASWIKMFSKTTSFNKNVIYMRVPLTPLSQGHLSY